MTRRNSGKQDALSRETLAEKGNQQTKRTEFYLDALTSTYTAKAACTPQATNLLYS